MDKLKKILILIFIIVIILIGIIYGLLKKQANTENNAATDNLEDLGGGYEPEEDDNGYKDVTDANIFFTVVNCVERYEKICKLNINNASEDVYINEDEYLLDIKNESQRKEAIIDLLDKKYIKQNNINENNVLDYVFSIDSDSYLISKKMKVKYGTSVNTYLYEVYLVNGQNISEKILIVRMNNSNSTFSIEFVNNTNVDISKIQVLENQDDIENTGYNKFRIKTMKTEEVAQEYMNNYKELVMADPSIIYNEYMDDEYKNNRFGSEEEFKNYINKNIDDIRICQLSKYAKETIEDNKNQYICVDQYDNYYIFDSSSVMQYTIKFDNYTIATDKFKKTYEDAQDEKKVQMNIDKFIQMINRQDYRTSYNCISQGFKNNYLNTQDKFENYIKNILFKYNKFEFKNIEKKGSNLYTCNLNITDLTGENTEVKNITLIMQLNEGLDFEMSFAIQ